MFEPRTILLTLHVLFAMLTIGWLLMQAMLSPRAIRDGNAGAVRFGVRCAEKVGPAAILVFLVGIALVLRDKNDGIDFSDKWVGIAMLLFVVALVNGAVFIGGAEKRALQRIEAGESATAEAGRVAMLGGINAVIVVVILLLMVGKPT